MAGCACVWVPLSEAPACCLLSACSCSPDVCRQLALRQPPLGVPIILVSALAEESSVVTGLDSGADDYITKPFRRAEFLARIRGKLQLASVEQQARQVCAQDSRLCLECGPWLACAVSTLL